MNRGQHQMMNQERDHFNQSEDLEALQVGSRHRAKKNVKQAKKKDEDDIELLGF